MYDDGNLQRNGVATRARRTMLMQNYGISIIEKAYNNALMESITRLPDKLYPCRRNAFFTRPTRPCPESQIRPSLITAKHIDDLKLLFSLSSTAETWSAASSIVHSFEIHEEKDPCYGETELEICEWFGEAASGADGEGSKGTEGFGKWCQWC